MAFILVILMQWLGLVHEIARLLVRQQKVKNCWSSLQTVSKAWSGAPGHSQPSAVFGSSRYCSCGSCPFRCVSATMCQRGARCSFTGCAVHSLPACFCGMDSTGATSPWHLRQMAQAFTTTFQCNQGHWVRRDCNTVFKRVFPSLNVHIYII